MILRSRVYALAYPLAFALTALAARMASAQSGTITIAAGAATSANIAPGAHFAVPVLVDMTAAGGLDLASLVTKVNWTPARLTLDSIRPGTFGSIQATIGTGTASVAMFNSTGTTGTATSDTIAMLYFTAATNTAGSRIALLPTLAGNANGTNITNRVGARNLDVCVAPQTPWGDANGDGTVDIIDAQQVARHAVQLSVTNPTALGSGDVNADGAVDVLDAAQIANSVVGNAVSPTRLGTMSSLIPDVASVAIQPASLDVGIGQKVQLLAVPQDVNGAPLTGCTPLKWNSESTSNATVDVNGIVSGVASGGAVIKATTFNGTVGTLSMTVSSPIATLTMSIDTATIHIGEGVALSAVARDGGGAVRSVPITFTSSDTSVATVSPTTGQVTSVNVGPVTITASSQDKTVSSRIQVSPLPENSLALGDDFSCMLSVAGAAYCWGSDSTFQLGDATTTDRNTPVAVSVPPSLRFTQIIAGSKGVCALATTQAVYCWGARYPSGAFVNPFFASAGIKVKSMAGWGSGTDSGICMLDVNGKMYCLGDGTRGQMGTGFSRKEDAPVAVSGGLTFQSVTANLYSVCGISSGIAYCWGDNRFYELGTDTTGNMIVPQPVAGGLTFASLVAGRALTCGVTPAGAGYCWGTGLSGGDGDGSLPSSVHVTPQPIAGGLTFKGVWGQVGYRDNSSSCGLTTDNTAYCWGSNVSGQVGNATASPSPCGSGACFEMPVTVETTSKFLTLRTGGEHACGITTDHAVLCWGSNVSGQLGDASNVNRPTPVRVVGGVRVP